MWDSSVEIPLDEQELAEGLSEIERLIGEKSTPTE
jgi:hypothetical protein